MGFFSFTTTEGKPIRNMYTKNASKEFYILIPKGLTGFDMKNIQVLGYNGYGKFFTYSWDLLDFTQILLFLNFDSIEQTEFNNPMQVLHANDISEKLRCHILDFHFDGKLKNKLRLSSKNIEYDKGKDAKDTKCQGYF